MGQLTKNCGHLHRFKEIGSEVKRESRDEIKTESAKSILMQDGAQKIAAACNGRQK